ncbi:MAG TPA: phosphoribosyltransferase family protein [Acidimicrobiia bacterium]|nr:phosphoribosyltransferase family protein [Acidimicrobiia bacterium]
MFEHRIEAGMLLGERLREIEADHPVILGLPRGGVPVAAEVARVLGAPLDVIVVRKLGVPFHPEYAMGAIGEGDVRFVDWQVVSDLGVSATQLERVIAQERIELRRRAKRFRAEHGPLDIEGRAVIIVDDGIATGSTVTAATRVARDLGAARVIVATPVAHHDTVRLLHRIADEVIVLETPRLFSAVGEAYAEFAQIDDEEVVATLRRMRQGLQPTNHSLSRSA